MKIATWNVNALRVRLPQVLAWLEKEHPFVLALQETKVDDRAFPVAEFAEAGWHVCYSGQPTYNGVALISALPPAHIQAGVPGLADPQRRALAASYPTTVLPGGWLRVVSLYVPNGQAPGSDKYAYKLEWLSHARDWLKQELANWPGLAIVGDYNIAPEDRDCHDPLGWVGHVLVSPLERAAFQRLLDLGLVDAFRLFEQPVSSFSWWDYRAASFRRNQGMRIDHILVSQLVATHCQNCYVDPTPRRSERPSDHTPVIMTITS